jgi:predicted nucleic acid-binding protein
VFGGETKAARAETTLAGGIIVSVQVPNEFTNVVRRKFGLEWARTLQALANIRRFADVRPPTIQTHERGVALRHGAV